MYNQAVEMRELIPEVVSGICTDSMACCPTEVFHFGIMYIKELQSENEKLRMELLSATDKRGGDIT